MFIYTHTVELCYSELSEEIKNSLKWQEFEIADSKIMTEKQIQVNGFEFKRMGNLK